MSRYENHIETRLATKNGLFQGVCRLLVTLHVLENEHVQDNRIYLTSRPAQDNANLYSPLRLTGNPMDNQVVGLGVIWGDRKKTVSNFRPLGDHRLQMQ